MIHTRLPVKRLAALLLTLLMLPFSSLALTNEERSALFEQRLAGLLTPDQLAADTGCIPLHPGDTAFAPCVSPGIIPFHKQKDNPPLPTASGTFSSSDEAVLSVSADGLMTAVAPGEATLICETENGSFTYQVTVSEDNLPRLIQNYIYVLENEFYSVQRKRLPKWNKYTKWYYSSKREVGWCSVFTIYCANAAGTDPITLNQLKETEPADVQFLQQGQVGHQYDGFLDMGRFVSVPKPGYLIIYANMKNGYRTTHVGSVIDVQDLGGGKYAVTTIEGNVSNSVKAYQFAYDSNKANHMVGLEKGLKLQWNMEELPADQQTDPLLQYELHTDYWSVFGFCQTWK